ncbi:hypothetical protein I4U23_016985 [Adineta vaga]|nr:hypothetical protein I4U23_016985 [Adineta vaga]
MSKSDDRSLAIVYCRQGKFDEALGMYDKISGYQAKLKFILQIQLESLSFDHPDFVSTYNILALIYAYAHDFDKAIAIV